MQFRNTTESYGIVARALHWAMALILIGLLALGLYMEGLPNEPSKFELYGVHKSFGILVLILGIIRVIWRQLNPVPQLPIDMPRWQKLGAHVSHAGLYGLMMAMPLLGWAMSSAGGHPVSMFGISIPPLLDKNPDIGKLCNQLHEWGGYAFIALIAAHATAGLFHHFVRNDNILRRMLRGA